MTDGLLQQLALRLQPGQRVHQVTFYSEIVKQLQVIAQESIKDMTKKTESIMTLVLVKSYQFSSRIINSCSPACEALVEGSFMCFH